MCYRNDASQGVPGMLSPRGAQVRGPRALWDPKRRMPRFPSGAGALPLSLAMARLLMKS